MMGMCFCSSVSLRGRRALSVWRECEDSNHPLLTSPAYFNCGLYANINKALTFLEKSRTTPVMTQTGKCLLKLWQQKDFQCEKSLGCFFLWPGMFVFTANEACRNLQTYILGSTNMKYFVWIYYYYYYTFCYALKRYEHRNVKFRPNVFLCAQIPWLVI